MDAKLSDLLGDKVRKGDLKQRLKEAGIKVTESLGLSEDLESDAKERDAGRRFTYTDEDLKQINPKHGEQE